MRSTEERNKALTLRGFEEMFNKGDLSVVDELVALGGEDHQEAPGTDFAEHLKDIISKMRAAFPDLRFEIHHVLAEGDIVATRSTMTGTHEGRFEIGPFKDIPPTGRRVEVAHMHFFRWVDGKNTDLWHSMDTHAWMRQLGRVLSERAYRSEGLASRPGGRPSGGLLRRSRQLTKDAGEGGLA